MAVTSSPSSSKPNGSVSGKKDKIKNPCGTEKDQESKPQKHSEEGPSSPADRNNSPGIPLAHGRICDPNNGKTCHQCRQRTRDFVAPCKNLRNNKPCPIKFCHKCLLNRYGENAEEVGALQEWSCPKCRGICNCSQCMKKRGHQPTGILIHAAKANGYSSVSEMLQIKGPENCYVEKSVKCINGSPRKRSAPEMEAVTMSPRKRGKENSFEGKINSNLCALPSPSNQVEKKSKKVKVEGSMEMHDDSTNNHVEHIALAGKRKLQGNQGDICSDDCSSLRKETSPSDGEKKPKKMKVEGSNGKLDQNILKTGVTTTPILNPEETKLKKDNLKEVHNGNKNDNAFVKMTSPRKRQSSNRTSIGDAKPNDRDPQERKLSKAKITMEGFMELIGKDKRKEEAYITDSERIVSDNGKNNSNNDTQARTGLETLNINKNNQRTQNGNIDADIALPQGTELTSVHDIQIPPEDVGKAVQFLEFCAVFGKVLGVKKEQPDYVLRDLIHGRSSRRGKNSLTVHFLSHLLSVIRKDRGQWSLPLSPTSGKNSWIHALTECISESGSVTKSLALDPLDKGADGFENLSSSKKLMILNFLCDEVLGTVKIRNWIEDQVSKIAEKAKEHKERVLAAKDKEKRLKKKIQDEIAKAIIQKNGDLLSISEHDAVISQIKGEAAVAHAEVLESKGLSLKNNQSSEAVRTEPIHLGSNGRAYWRLKCLSNKSDILAQDFGTGDTSASDEKWFAFEEEQKEVIEKHINIFRGKTRMAQRVPLQQQSQKGEISL
ncbi:hypothetical protein ACH5RR_011720 [Cinchona calisaya]|uniref:DDT domain-containing protein n=1 Tax=Cinchona calisaya TaxID=153742 RepID=A0ABD3A5T8_9GENT